MSASPEKLAGFDWPAISAILDSVNLMTYDFEGGWSDRAGHNAALYPVPGQEASTFACATAVQYMLGRGVPRAKLAMGLAFYGRGVVCNGAATLGAPTVKVAKTIQPDGPIVTAGDFATWEPFDATPTYQKISQVMASGWTRHWDDVAKVPYLTKGTSFLSYDDSRSIGYKAAYVRDQQLGGVIVWTAFGDLRAGAITNPSGKLPFSPTTDAPLINVVNSVLAGDPLPADGTEGPAPASGPTRGLDTLPVSRPIISGYLNALRNATGQDQVITDFPAAVHAANLKAFDLVITAFAEPMADGTLGTGLGAFASYLPAVVSEGHGLGKSVIVSIGGAYPAALANNFATVAASPSLRQTFADNIVAFLAAHDLDGLDIDFEFPADAGTARTNFTLLMQTIHQTVKTASPRYIVMFGSGPGWYLGGFAFAALKDHCDFFFYFGYDWKNPANGPIQKPGLTQWTQANDQLPQASVKGGIDYVLGKGFPATKLLCGLPFHGSNNRSWSAVRNLWAANQAAYSAAIDANSLEVQIDGEWFTPPDAMKRKMGALLSTTQSLLAGGAVIRGVGCWEIGHEHGSQPDLSTAFTQWLDAASGTAAILNVTGGSIGEGNFGTSTLNFTVTLSRALASSVSVNYATADGTATAGSDYVSNIGTLVFAAGETSKTIPVTIIGDETVESNETFSLTLAGPTGATLGTATATGTITNDDASAPGVNDGWTCHALQTGLTPTLVTTANWGSGFQAELRLSNNTGAALSTWSIQFDAAFTVSSMSDGVYGGKSGVTHTVTSPTWGGYYVLANGATGVIGMIGAGTIGQPTNLRLNGQPIGNAGTLFAAWAAARGVSGISGDNDGDARPHLVEFLNGTSPAASDAGHRAERRNLTVAGQTAEYFCVVVPVDRTAANVEYRVIAGSEPSFATSRLMLLHQTADLDNNRIEAVWRDTVPLSWRPRAFARIEARIIP